MTARSRAARRPGPPPSPVSFRFSSPAQPQLPVELRGDFIHWFVPHPLAQQATTSGEAAQWLTTLSLSPGVYAYKFRSIDGRWHVDPENPRTRSVVPGEQNSLLVLEGADEPILHAPFAPFLYRRPDGLLCLRAGLRRGHGDSLSLQVQEGGLGVDSSSTLMPLRRVPLADEAEHLLFEATLPLHAQHVDYLFVLPDGRRIGRSGCGQALRVSEPLLPAPPPRWWQQAVVYTIFIDRFARRDGVWPGRLLDEKARMGGDLWGVLAALPYLQDLGVNVLHLSPIVQSPSAHRYDAENPLVIDPSLGGEPALHALIEEADRRGMRLIADWVHTHVHRNFLPFCDVRARGHASPFADWFYILRHPFLDQGDAGPDPGYAHYQKGQWQEPLLRNDHPQVMDYLCRVAQRYLQLGFAGLRVDAASDAPPVLLQRLRQAVGRDALLLGEVTTDNVYRFAPTPLHAVTDFAPQRALLAWLDVPTENHQDAQRSASEATHAAAAALSRSQVARGAPQTALVFTATHDQPRLWSCLRDRRRAQLGLVLTLLQAPVPALLYGDELGLHAPSPSTSDEPAAHARDFDDAWPDRLPFPAIESAAPKGGDPSTLQLVRDLLRLRRSLPALFRGQEEFFTLPDAPTVLGLRRRDGDQIVEVYARHGRDADEASAAAGSEPEPFLLSPDAPSAATLLCSCGDAQLWPCEDSPPRLVLGPWSAVVVARHAPAAATELWRQLADQNRAIGAAAFRHGQTQGLFLPSHLYVTVTERCNLRCLHCITDAPQRTQDGRARTVQPWLLDALAPAFSVAEYIAFVHGGESLMAPIFFDVLTQIKRARAGRRCDVHLLSNGMLLSQTMVDRLIDHGVNSLSISLDGGSAQTNDRLRVGADFDRILHNLRGLIELRSRRGADLRVGVSLVLTQDNQHELSALAERLADLGIDWLKLEEMFPTSLIAVEELLVPHGRRARAVVVAVRQALRGRVVLVDHLQDEARCPCALSEEHIAASTAACSTEANHAQGRDHGCAACAFRAADDFANRAHFHPCRSDWEQACIDPDGTVHPGDYGQPAIGNVASEPLLALWQGPAMQRRRAEALAALPAQRRMHCTR